MSAKVPRVAVAYNAPVLPRDHPDAASEADVVEVARAVADALRIQSFEPILIPAKAPLNGFLEALDSAKPDLVFNLIEGFNGISAGATHLTSVFELLGLPYTGSPVEALAACVSKSRAKALLRGSGLPTTDSYRLESEGELSFAINLLFPHALQGGEKDRIHSCYLVKPDAEDGSLGIDQSSVVTNAHELQLRVEFLLARYGGGVIVEPYLPGPEFNLGVIAVPEPRALAVAQIVFKPEIGNWPILTYAAKWDEGSVADLASRPICPAPIDPSRAERLSTIAVAAFQATGCRDYARVDLRLDKNGEPMILEVNPNPDIGPNAGWARAARVSGFSYEEAIGAIAREALKRGVES